MSNNGFNVLSLFDGMSCGQIALQKAGIKVNKYYASEIEKDAMMVTQHNFPNTIQVGDISKLKTEDFKDVDIIFGGSPCTNFSFAGKMEGLRQGEVEITSLEQYLQLKEDGFEFNGQSYLFWEWVRLVKEIKPKYFMLENVKMVKKWSDLITSILEVEPVVINSKLVSGQLRHRLYWTNIPNVTVPEDKEIEFNDILTEGYTPRKKALAIMQSENRPVVRKCKLHHRASNVGFINVIYSSKDAYDKITEYHDSKYKGKPAKEVADDHEVYNECRILNQTELERLQTVPEGYTSCLTRNQAAGVLGNGWTVDVIAHIFKNIK
jgi:DNA-cytosine methyltransferase